MLILLHSWRRRAILSKSIDAVKVVQFQKRHQMRKGFTNLAKAAELKRALREKEAIIVTQRYYRDFKQ